MSKTFKEYEKENTIICPNCHIQIKTGFIPMSIFDNIHEDMYISHEDEYFERKALQQRINKVIEELEEEIEQSDGCIYVELPEELYIKKLQKYLDILRGGNNE